MPSNLLTSSLFTLFSTVSYGSYDQVSPLRCAPYGQFSKTSFQLLLLCKHDHILPFDRFISRFISLLSLSHSSCIASAYALSMRAIVVFG